VTKTLDMKHLTPEHVFFNADVYQGGRNMASCLRTPLEVNNDGGLSDDTMESRSSTGVTIFGTGLQNEVGEYNCFLNVIIQVTLHFS
jgi:hypothetical protein